MTPFILLVARGCRHEKYQTRGPSLDPDQEEELKFSPVLSRWTFLIYILVWLPDNIIIASIIVTRRVLVNKGEEGKVELLSFQTYWHGYRYDIGVIITIIISIIVTRRVLVNKGEEGKVEGTHGLQMLDGSPLHDVYIWQYIYLATEQTETYRKSCILIYLLTYICPSSFDCEVNTTF